MSAKVRTRLLWRWRRNPLRRRSDVVEAWVALVAGLVMAVGGTAAGVATADAVEQPLLVERAERHQVPARLLEDAPATQPSADGSRAGRVPAEVRWKAPDGSVRTGTAQVPEGHAAGTATVVWTDGHGRLVPEPLTPREAETRAALTGATAAAGVGLVTLAGRRVVRWRLDRHRAEEWERAWAEVEPRWSSRGG
ncbi:Rv1733c family protein [Streptomyces cuspidosporus]|uniref:Membrane protein SCJ1.26 n=1 Tax=Streptomyces cuspidosporus TaxID=66882 RepID=A0ABN3FR07_9ACTN